jgi:hypothetical protein
VTFTKLEEAALHAIFAETADLAPALEEQLRHAALTDRENTSGGFFTTISVPEDAARVKGPKVPGYETSARFEGLADGLGFVLFLKAGRLHLLEGFAWSPESAAALDLDELDFTIERKPVQIVGKAVP